jgi:hypothetical protein
LYDLPELQAQFFGSSFSEVFARAFSRCLTAAGCIRSADKYPLHFSKFSVHSNASPLCFYDFAKCAFVCQEWGHGGHGSAWLLSAILWHAICKTSL